MIRGTIRRGFTVVATGLLALEGLTWARLGTLDLVHARYPWAGATSDGEGFHWRWTDASEPHTAFRLFRADGTEAVVRRPTRGGDPAEAAWGRYAPARMGPHAAPWAGRLARADKTFETPAFLRALWGGRAERPPPPEAVLAARMGMVGASRRWIESSLDDGRWTFRWDAGPVPGGAGVLGDGGPLGGAVVTPDGVFGPDATPTGRFSRLTSVATGGPDPRTVRAIDETADGLVGFTVRVDVLDAAPYFTVGVERVPLGRAAALAPGATPPAYGDIGVARLGRRFVLVDRAWTVWSDVTLTPEEAEAGPSVDATGSRFSQGPVRWRVTTQGLGEDPLVVRTRVRMQRLGEPERTVEVAWSPRGTLEEALAGLACVPAVLRPLPLVAASALADPPQDGTGGQGWWALDPIVAGGRRPVVVVLAAVLAAACAAVAWRWGRVHAASRRGALGFLLVGAMGGWVGLLVLRLVAIRAVAVPVGAGRRSLALTSCPSTSAPWPPPPPRPGDLLLRDPPTAP